MKKILAILLSFSLVSLVLADSYSGGGGSSKWDSESNTTVFVDVQYPNAVLRDGSRTMTAPLDFNTHWVTGMSRVESTEGTVFLLDSETNPLRLADFDLNLNTKTVTNGSYYGNGAGLTSLNELDPLAVLATGARAMSGNLDMGGNSITNVATNSIVFADGTTLGTGDITTWTATKNGFTAYTNTYVHAHYNNSGSSLTLDSCATDTAMPFNDEWDDAGWIQDGDPGGNYDTSTYTYTVPEDGLYYMMYNLYTQPSGNYPFAVYFSNTTAGWHFNQMYYREAYNQDYVELNNGGFSRHESGDTIQLQYATDCSGPPFIYDQSMSPYGTDNGWYARSYFMIIKVAE
jgi:hypothetical protein